jgi:uncharacterized membrane protein
MISAVWRKRFSILFNRLFLYPAPEPLPQTRLFWFATALVTVAVVLFCSYFILYLTTRHDALLTTAEDLGIMDQALWNLVHGNGLHQTICNILHDTNCYSVEGVNRFAIHFEPILFPISLLYLIAPGPKTLLIVQTIVVALGAYPAFWLARLRLRNDLAGVAIAILYLLYPGQQQATTYDFHAVTLSCALLLFTLYFLYTRRTVLLFVFAILSMGCKEQMPLVIVMIGLWAMLFQRRWRTGLGLILLGLAWWGVAFYLVMPHASPTGKPLLLGRYNGLGKGPVEVVLNIVRHPRSFLMDHLIEHSHRMYVQTLLSPAGYLPLLAPWILVLASSSIALNLLSASAGQYSGLFQYSADIVPILIFATIEAMVLLLWLAQVLYGRVQAKLASRSSLADEAPAPTKVRLPVIQGGLLIVLLGLVLFTSLRSDYYFHGQLPYAQGFRWPRTNAHTALAQHFMDMIPPDASVSAQATLAPHLSERKHIYQFPYAVPLSYPVTPQPATVADYVFLDVSADIYPYYTTPEFVRDIKSLLVNKQYGIVAAQDGYLLLKHGLSAPDLSPASAVKPGPDVSNALVLPDFPANFCSYVYVSPQDVPHPLQARFTDAQGSMDLVGYSISGANPFSRSGDYMAVTTYWRVTKPMAAPVQMLFLLKDKDSKEYYANNDVPAIFWCQSQTWEPGKIVRVTTRQFSLRELATPKGLAQMSVSLLPLVQSSSKIMDMQTLMQQPRLPVHVISGANAVSATQDTNTVPLMPMTIVP